MPLRRDGEADHRLPVEPVGQKLNGQLHIVPTPIDLVVHAVDPPSDRGSPSVHAHCVRGIAVEHGLGGGGRLHGLRSLISAVGLRRHRALAHVVEC